MKIPGLFLAATTALSAMAAEWSQFRGPNASGVGEAAGLPAALKESDIVWTAPLPGKGHSSPVAWGSTLFVTAEDAAKPGIRYVLAFDGASGRERWRHEDSFTPYPQHQFNSYAASTPACDAQRVFVSWIDGTQRQVLALDHTGKKLWEKNLGHYAEPHGSSASPIVFGDLLIVPNDCEASPDAGIYALAVATGEEKWKTATRPEKTSFSTPIVARGPDGASQLVLSSNPVALLGLDPATGRELWRFEHRVPEARAVGTPVVLPGGVIFVTVGQGGNGRSGIALQPGSSDGKTPPRLVWEATNRLPYVPTPVAVGANLFFLNDGGILSAVRAADGERLWDERGPGKAYSSLACINGTLIAVGRDGTVLTATAGERYQPLGEVKLGDECQTSPALAAGRLVIRTNTKLVAFGGGLSAAKP